MGLTLVYTLASQVIVWLPCLPVPLSLQPAPLFIAALVFGWPAVIAYGMYLLEGALGLPVFAGFMGGAARLLGPTGGYLWGFGLAMIFLVFMRRYFFRSAIKLLPIFAAIICAHLIPFTWGLAQLAWFVPADKLLETGLYPFIIGDFVLKPLFVLAGVGLLTVTQKTNT